MKLLKLSMCAALACLVSGCAGYGMISKNLGDDGAILVIDSKSIYGQNKLTRVGETTNSVVIDPDGTIIINGKFAK